MKSREEVLRELARQTKKLCGELGSDDGVDPRFEKHGARRKKDHRKTRQLCQQVREALELTLASAQDETLLSLIVLAVEPAPDSSHLLVLVGPSPIGEPVSEPEALAALGRAAGILRSEVTAAIHRRRTPELTYRYLPFEGGRP
jgi:ribosome-binding factor A